ncbi:6458_t:CDS:2, partial [Diversispora eburnea]
TFTNALIISSRNVTSVQELQKERQKHLTKAHEYHENDIVLLYDSAKRQVYRQNFNPKWTGPFWIEKKLDACNAEVDFDLELYDKGDILSLVSVAIDTTKTNGQRLFAYLKSWSLLSKDLVKRQLTMKQLKQEVQQITGQNGARFLTVVNRVQRLLSVLGEFSIPQFRYITPNWLYHLTS